jgi:REP element-mobilizing transposase RayT
MSEGYQIRNQEAIHYLTFQVINWMDVFTRKSYRDVLIESLIHCRDKKGLNIHAFVIMSHHIHCILSSKTADLSGTIRDFKTHTSKAIIAEMQLPDESRKEWMLGQMKYYAKTNKRNSEHQFWTQENHPVELYSNKFKDQKLDYIHQNPVRAGIVEEPWEYIYSSARAYCDMKCILEIDYL